MSTSSISSAVRRTSSGRRSLTGAPVIVATASDDALEVLDVHRRHDVDAGIADDLDVLPALVARRPRHVRVGELVDQRDRRLAREDRVGVHLLDDDAAVLDPAARHDLEAVEQARSCAAGRAPRRSRRRGRSRGRPAGDPPRASGTSCRRRAPCRCRPAAGPDPCPPRPGLGRASRRRSGGRRRRRGRFGHRRITARADRRDRG